MLNLIGLLGRDLYFFIEYAVAIAFAPSSCHWYCTITKVLRLILPFWVNAFDDKVTRWQRKQVTPLYLHVFMSSYSHVFMFCKQKEQFWWLTSVSFLFLLLSYFGYLWSQKWAKLAHPLLFLSSYIGPQKENWFGIASQKHRLLPKTIYLGHAVRFI